MQFEEQVKFQLKQLEKFIFESKEIPVVNQKVWTILEMIANIRQC